MDADRPKDLFLWSKFGQRANGYCVSNAFQRTYIAQSMWPRYRENILEADRTVSAFVSQSEGRLARCGASNGDCRRDGKH